ncbi:MAG TPA: pyruvate ferredoxin oxidoreductase [Firmicutes bacterium]|nr:pyruvate ferredoxin oxidoreductase [Bacillota bacterium]
MANLKEIAKKVPERLTGGHRLCPGCGAAIAARQILMGTEDPVVIANATGCLEVATTIYPYTAWNTPWIHNAFENAAATISGVEAAYQSFKRQGKIPKDKKIKFLAFGGDGGTYDIGLQSLSGALERGHDFVYVCYDNEGYMNTGIQRSSATPKGAHTTTSPCGEESFGKKQQRKDLAMIIAAHGIPYVAQASVGNYHDLIGKAKKAFDTEGPAFINVFAPCQRGWGHKPEATLDMGKMAVETCFWPLFEVIDGKIWKITYKPKEKLPIEEFLKIQARFKHLKEDKNKAVIAEIQKDIDEKWEFLLNLEKSTNPEHK